MRVLLIVQQVDERDWLRAFTLRWIRALAERVETLYVLTLEHGEAQLPANVHVFSMGKEKRLNRVLLLLNFYRHLFRLVGKVDAIISHMTPRYTYLAAPLAWLFNVPQLLWYTHNRANWELNWALRFARYALTAVPDSFPIHSSKVRVMGHGIDANFFAPDTLRFDPDELPTIVHVARLMPIKNQRTLLKALGMGVAARALLVGDVPEGQDPSYRQQLQNLIRETGIGDRVIFTGGLSADGVRGLYRRAAVSVNLSPPGLFDKAALESMLCGTPTIVSNQAFDDLLGEYASQLRIANPEDAAGLAERLRWLLALPQSERAKIGVGLRDRTRAAHSLDRLMDNIVALLKTL
jgi:glycosyltransferase involved in cell wall biosynthesis